MRSVESVAPEVALAREAPIARGDPAPRERVPGSGTRWITDPAAVFDGPNCVYLSPHHDDVCFSLGAIARRLPGGRLINLFTHSTHRLTRNDDDADGVTGERTAEDAAFAAACRFSRVDIGLPDAPLLGRGPGDLSHLVTDAAALRPVLAARLNAIAEATPASETLTLFCPAGIGGHANHVATMMSVIGLLPVIEARYRVLFYEDLPYAANTVFRESGLLRLFAALGDRRGVRLASDFGAAADAKLALVNLYASQFVGPQVGCDRFSPAALDGPYRLHEAVWDFGIGGRVLSAGGDHMAGRAPTASPTATSAVKANGRERLVAGLLTIGDNAVPKPMFLPVHLGEAAASGRKLPQVTAVMLTANRPQQARLAVGCYRRQSWPNRRLLIGNTGDDRSLEPWLEELGDPSIDLVPMARAGRTLGELRNALVDRADGDFVCVWDDDDLHHRHRIETQMAAVTAAGADACVLARITIWSPGTAQVAIPKHRPWEGTLLCRRAVMPRYAPVETSEDTPVVNALKVGHRFLQIDAADLYVYVWHAANTSGDEHFRTMVNRSPDRFSGAEYGLLLTRMADEYPIREYLSLMTGRPA
jgi:hypothetical protein